MVGVFAKCNSRRCAAVSGPQMGDSLTVCRLAQPAAQFR